MTAFLERSLGDSGQSPNADRQTGSTLRIDEYTNPSLGDANNPATLHGLVQTLLSGL